MGEDMDEKTGIDTWAEIETKLGVAMTSLLAKMTLSDRSKAKSGAARAYLKSKGVS